MTTPAVVSPSAEELVKRDGQIAHADAGRVIDGVGDGGGGANDPELPDPLHAQRVDVPVLRLDPGDLNGLHIRVGGDVVPGEVVVDVVPEARVQHALFVQRHR